MTIAVIGTGLAGLACAQLLSQSGKTVVLFDKSRGYGERMASRRRDNLSFDHGLPAFDPLTSETIPALEALPEWDTFGRVAAPRMNAFPRTIGEGFTSYMGSRITSIDPDMRIVTDEAGASHGPFSKIIVAIPAPQASELLAGHGAAFVQIADATYMPCWTLMLGGVRGDMTPPSRSTPPTGPISLLLRDDVKPGHPAQEPCYVAHARADWSLANLERGKEEVARELSDTFATITKLDPETATYRAAHRWRFAQPARVVSALFLLSEDGNIGACGDWCGEDRSGGNARAAWRSGEALGRAILE